MGTVEDIIKEKNLAKMPPSELDALVQSVLKGNEHIVAEYLAGKQKAMNALVGKVMEQAKLRADAKDVVRILKTLCYVISR